MKTINLLGFLILAIIISGCATVYTASELQNHKEKHQVIAILPFDVTVSYNKLPNRVTVQQIEENEFEMGFVLQNQMYNRFLRKAGQYTVDFQDIDKTNMMLKRNKIDVRNLNEYSKDELARLLDVDVVISGRVLTTKPMSTGAALALGILFDFWGPTNTADVTVSLHDGKDSRLLWKFNHVYSGSVGSSAEELTNAMMRPISRKFPYRI